MPFHINKESEKAKADRTWLNVFENNGILNSESLVFLSIPSFVVFVSTMISKCWEGLCTKYIFYDWIERRTRTYGGKSFLHNLLSL